MVSYDWTDGGPSRWHIFQACYDFGSMGGVSAILANDYEVQGQNCVARLQGRIL